MLVACFPSGLAVAEANFGDDHMSLKLVASNKDRALAIRDHLLLLVRQGGGLEVQRDRVRLVTLERLPGSSITGRPSTTCNPRKHPRRATGMP